MTAALSLLFWPLHKAVELFAYDTYYKAADELWASQRYSARRSA